MDIYLFEKKSQEEEQVNHICSEPPKTRFIMFFNTSVYKLCKHV